MTEPTGRTARWGTALILLPTSAAVLGGVVWWADATTPRPQAIPQAPARVAPAAPPVDAQVVAARAALERRLAVHRENAARLQRRLATIKAQMKRLDHGAGPAAGGGTVLAAGSGSGGGSGGGSAGTGAGSSGGGGSNGSGGGSGGGSGSGSGGGGAAPAPAPVVQPAPAPAPAPAPPPTNGGTGASGAP
jgi:hypothetical protein